MFSYITRLWLETRKKFLQQLGVQLSEGMMSLVIMEVKLRALWNSSNITEQGIERFNEGPYLGSHFAERRDLFGGQCIHWENKYFSVFQI